MAATFSSTLAWVTTTPLGVRVDPEVYWINAGACGSMSGALHRCASVSSASVTNHCRAGPPTSATDFWVFVAVSAAVSAKRARASGTTTASRGASFWCTGTATAPAYRQPNARYPATAGVCVRLAHRGDAA
jgi:hypothetical protein